MPKVSYAQKNRGERQLLQSLFDDEQREKTGGYFGVEFGRRRPFDQGGISAGNRGAIGPTHAINRRHGTSRITGLGRSGDADFGNGNFGYAHVDGNLARRSYAPEQTSYRAASQGAGLSGSKPAWPSVNRVRANAGNEYLWDSKGDYWYGGRSARGPF